MTDSFVALSEVLTGFDRAQLLGTGMAQTYFETVQEALPAGVLEELLSAAERLPEGLGREGGGQAIVDDPKLGPVAQSIILLWYCGKWTALSREWQRAYGTSPLAADRVISAEAYLAGLQWVAARAHPMGAKAQGFGSWAQPPEGVTA